MALVPYITEDTGRGERAMDIFSRLLQDRIVLIGEEISDQLANVVIAQLLFLWTQDPKKDIQMFINSPGGYMTAGLAIYDTMRFLGCDISTLCIGQASSMGALLLAAGTKGKRRALPHSRIMIHQPSGGIMGTSADIKVQAKEILRQKENMISILALCSGQDRDRVHLDCDRDYYMSPEEAIGYGPRGLVDEVVTTSKPSLKPS